MRNLVMSLLVPLPLLLTPGGVAADESRPIQDNSFLVEEAYNQEPGVIQHIGSYQRDLDSGAWTFAFTEEWPLWGQRHQISVTVPVEAHPGAGLGAVQLSYRLQLGGGRVALAPRATALFPTGGERAAGQVNLPLSVELPAPFVIHLNAGATVSPGAEAPAIGTAGASLVWLTHARFNVLVEGFGQKGGGDRLFVSPGVRAAIDIGPLQIVPGLAVPIGVGPSAGEVDVLAYLSFEHPITR